MLWFLLYVAGLVVVARVFWVAGFKTASRYAADIARMASVAAARADVPIPPQDYIAGDEWMESPIPIEQCSVCGEPGCPDHM